MNEHSKESGNRLNGQTILRIYTTWLERCEEVILREVVRQENTDIVQSLDHLALALDVALAVFLHVAGISSFTPFRIFDAASSVGSVGSAEGLHALEAFYCALLGS